MSLIIQQIFNGLVVGAVYSLFAVGFNLVFGVQKVMNLAHGANFMVGALVGLYTVFAGFPLWAAFIAAILAGAITAALVELVAFRKLRNRREAEFATIVASIGADMIIMNLALQFTHGQVQRFPFAIAPTEALSLFGLRILPLQLIICSVMLVMLGALSLLLYRTSFGRQIRAVASNARAAVLLGVEPNVVYFSSFLIAGALAGVAGILVGLAFNSVHYAMGEPYLLKGFVVVVLGGLGSLSGGVIAGLVLGVVQVLTSIYFPSGFGDILVYLCLFTVLLLFPTGLMGSKAALGGHSK